MLPILAIDIPDQPIIEDAETKQCQENAPM
jgi:hypothetical protein